MTRVEAIARLKGGGTVTHPEIAHLPLRQKGSELYYLYEGKEVYAGDRNFFWMGKQQIVWDTGWTDLSDDGSAGTAG